MDTELQPKTTTPESTNRMQVVREQIRRLWTWWAVALLSLGGVFLLAPQQAEILVYKLCLITFAVIVSYWADRILFKFAPPIVAEMPVDVVSASRIIARAVVAHGIISGLANGI